MTDSDNFKHAQQIDEAFSELIIKLQKDGCEAPEVLFVGLNSLIEFGFYETSENLAVVFLALNVLVQHCGKRVPAFPFSSAGDYLH